MIQLVINFFTINFLREKLFKLQHTTLILAHSCHIFYHAIILVQKTKHVRKKYLETSSHTKRNKIFGLKSTQNPSKSNNIIFSIFVLVYLEFIC